MASGDIFYTTPSLEQATVLSVSAGDTTTNPRHNVLDQNLNTYWSPGSGVRHYLNIDCAQASTVNAFGLFITNFNSNFSTAFMVCSGSNDTSSWTGLKVSHIDHQSGPLAVTELNSPATYRYYRFSLVNSTGTPLKIGYAFLMTKRQLQNRDEYLQGQKYPSYDNEEAQVGLKKFVHSYTKRPVYAFTRVFSCIGANSISSAESVFTDSAGIRNVFVYKETPSDTNPNNWYVCRMDKDEPKYKINDFQFETLTFNFHSLPYVLDGETS